MSREVSILVLLFLLASTLSQTTLGETKTFLVNWTKEHNGNWFPIGTTIYDGDILEFVFNQTDYNVVVVNKHAYETCEAPSGTSEYNSGDDEIPVKKGENFFICTKMGCCENNVKMTIIAAAGPRPTG